MLKKLIYKKHAQQKVYGREIEAYVFYPQFTDDDVVDVTADILPGIHFAMATTIV